MRDDGTPLAAIGFSNSPTDLHREQKLVDVENALREMLRPQTVAMAVITDNVKGFESQNQFHRHTVLPTSSRLRKQFPLHTGCMEYFPNALLCVSHQSWLGNQQHHPDKPLHWDKSKSQDESDAGARHGVERELVAKAWRALAELERALLNGYKPWSYLSDISQTQTKLP